MFDCRAIDIGMSASKASAIKVRVKEEERWLTSGNSILTVTEIQEVGSLLFESKPQQEILRIKDVFVDANDVSTLVAERYLNGFVIDAICLKYCEEAVLRGSPSLYLPSLTQTWVSSGNCSHLQSKLKPYVTGRNLATLQWILTPIHVNGNHWGLLCMNISSKQAFFDDGLAVNYPSDLPSIVQRLVEAISLNPAANWSESTPIRRFGMPQQPLVGEGCGSCGVGVILAAHDFLNTFDSSLPVFQWKFKDMTKHRQRLLLQIAHWK